MVDKSHMTALGRKHAKNRKLNEYAKKRKRNNKQ